MTSLDFTIAETAALTGTEERGVRNELEKDVIGSPADAELRLPFAALVYFDLLREIRSRWPRALDPPMRTDLFRKLEKALAIDPTTKEISLDDLMTFRIGPAVARASEKATRFRRWCETIVVDDNIKAGEPVFPNTRLSVRHIGGLLARNDEARREVEEDYPYLSAEDLEFAPLFVRAYPRVGRPTAKDSAR